MIMTTLMLKFDIYVTVTGKIHHILLFKLKDLLGMGPVCENVKHDKMDKLEQVIALPSKSNFEEVPVDSNTPFQNKVA